MDVAHGEVIAGLASCEACHTVKGGAPYSGGYAVETRYGTFYGPNITPDPEYGIGAWTDSQFADALKTGHDADGDRLWPAFPYTSFTAMSDADIADLRGYLASVPPSQNIAPEADLNWPYGGMLGIWRALAFRPHAFEADPERTDGWNRGAYLVRVVGHCGECHSPRGSIGRVKRRHELTGNDDPPEPAPDISLGSRRTGSWTEADWRLFLEDGESPDGDIVGGVMRDIVKRGTSKLDDADLDAMIEYLRSVE